MLYANYYATLSGYYNKNSSVKRRPYLSLSFVFIEDFYSRNPSLASLAEELRQHHKKLYGDSGDVDEKGTREGNSDNNVFIKVVFQDRNSSFMSAFNNTKKPILSFMSHYCTYLWLLT